MKTKKNLRQVRLNPEPAVFPIIRDDQAQGVGSLRGESPGANP